VPYVPIKIVNQKEDGGGYGDLVKEEEEKEEERVPVMTLKRTCTLLTTPRRAWVVDACTTTWQSSFTGAVLFASIVASCSL
jgi:hypothetical protein